MVTTSHALTIDDFSGGGAADKAEASKTVPTAAKTTVTVSAIGGKRALFISRNANDYNAITNPNPSTSNGLASIYADDQLFHNQDGGVRAASKITWDAHSHDVATQAVTGNGLGDVNFYQDSANNVEVFINSFDFANGQTADVVVSLFDSRVANGSVHSDVIVTLDKAVSNYKLTIPFTLFASAGPSTITAPSGTFVTHTVIAGGAAVDLHHVGAIQMLVNGQFGDSDLYIDYIRTDGGCSAVPDLTGKVIDDCGVCKDTTLYEKSKDDCGVCSGANKNKDICGICFGKGDSCLDCSGAPFGGKTIDRCNVCGGDGSTCLDCRGVVYGGVGNDICGVCGGNGTSCADCAGVPFGTSKLDACGICNGGTSDTTACRPTIQCVQVAATSDILKFEKRLITQAKTLKTRFTDDVSRNKAKKCGINVKSLQSRVNSAYEDITNAGTDIFSKGVEVCGDSCVTVSFADQVTALQPTFKIIESNSTSLASKVKTCYTKKRILGVNGGIGVTQTISNVKSELKQLIQDCRNKKVCPPGK